MKIQLDMYQTIAVAVVVLMLGKFLRERVELLERFCIPAPVIGGVIFAIFTCICYVTGIAEFSFVTVPVTDLPLPPLSQRHERLIGQIPLHRAVYVHLVGLHGGVGGRTPVVFHHAAVLPDAAAQLGNGVGGPHHGIEEARKKGPSLPPCGEVRDVHLCRDPGEGKEYLPETGELPAAWALGHVDQLMAHRPPPVT